MAVYRRMSNFTQRYASGSTLKTSLVLSCILFLAVTLRIIFIGNHSLWLDELFSLRFSGFDLPELIREVAASDNHPPTYYIVLHYWVLIFGDTEASLRAPSAIFSSLSVYFSYKVGELLFNKRVAALAALLLAISEFSIYHAQEARMYSLLAFTSVLSVYFLLKLLKKQTMWSLFNYVWSTTFLAYTHLYGLFIILAENIYILSCIYAFNNKTTGIQTRHWASTQILIFLLSLPWFVILVNHIITIKNQEFWVSTPTPVSILNTITTFTGSFTGSLVWILLTLLGILYAPIIKSGVGRIHLRQQLVSNEGKHIFLLCLLLFTPIILPFVISQFVTPIYITRCTIAGHFAFYLLVANGIMHIRRRNIRIMALTIVLALSFKALVSRGYVHNDATEFRSVVEYIKKNATDNDLVLLCSHSHLDWPFKHYAEKLHLPSRILSTSENDILIEQLDANQLWFLGLTNKATNCQQYLPPVTKQYTRTENRDNYYKNLWLTLFEKKSE